MAHHEVDLTISIVSFNSAGVITQCLDSIYRHEHPFSYEVIVVDNNSQDGTVSAIKERYPQCRVIHNRKNWGYARASNQAIQEGRGRYHLILNPDIVVVEGAIEKMLAYMEAHPEVGVAGCRLLHADGKLQLSCRRFPTLATFLLRGTHIGDLLPRLGTLERYLLANENHDRDLSVDWCLGSCLMTRRETLDSVGCLDDRFFLYYEDIDFCYRVKQKKWKVAYISDAEMIHHYARRSAAVIPNRYTLHHLRSALYFFWKFRKERGLRTLV